VPNMQKPDN
jgi:hypothetical protein